MTYILVRLIDILIPIVNNVSNIHRLIYCSLWVKFTNYNSLQVMFTNYNSLWVMFTYHCSLRVKFTSYNSLHVMFTNYNSLRVMFTDYNWHVCNVHKLQLTREYKYLLKITIVHQVLLIVTFYFHWVLLIVLWVYIYLILCNFVFCNTVTITSRSKWNKCESFKVVFITNMQNITETKKLKTKCWNE